MNTLEKNKLPKVTLQNRVLTIKMLDGRQISVDLTEFSKLREVSIIKLKDYEISPFGIHWSKLDEDLSFEGFLKNSPD